MLERKDIVEGKKLICTKTSYSGFFMVGLSYEIAEVMPASEDVSEKQPCFIVDNCGDMHEWTVEALCCEGEYKDWKTQFKVA